jgi:hypothetical protein
LHFPASPTPGNTEILFLDLRTVQTSQESLIIHNVRTYETKYIPRWQSGDTWISPYVFVQGTYYTLRASHSVIAPDDGSGTMFSW